jgi:hypothetical protein
MPATPKVVESAQRLRYVRALERFLKGVISYLANTPELNQAGYDKKIENSLKLLNRIEEIDLYKGDLKDLQLLVKKMISYKGSQGDVEEMKEELLHSANQLEKSKNARRYKKEKYENTLYDDWK